MITASSRSAAITSRAVLAVAAAVAFAPVADARLVTFGQHGAWRISADLDPSNRLTRCIASGRYKSGIYFAVIYHTGRKFWYLQFFDPSWPERKGRTSVDLSIDGNLVSRTNLVWVGRSALLSLGNSVDGVVKLMKGNALTIATPAGKSTFSLTGSFGATKKVVECVKHYQNSPGPSARGAFGTTPGTGAFGSAPGATSSDWKLARSDTLPMAVAYLDKRGLPYRILPEEKHIFKHLPVNWMYSSRAYGGMVAPRRGRLAGTEAMGIMLSSHTRICDIKAAFVRDKPVTSDNVTTLRAKGACESTKGTYIAEFTVIERAGKAAVMIVEMMDQSQGSGRKSPPAQSPPARPIKPPSGLQEG